MQHHAVHALANRFADVRPGNGSLFRGVQIRKALIQICVGPDSLSLRLHCFATAPSSASRFSRRRPLTLTTGMPTARDSAEVSMLMPCCLATSSLVTPITTRYGYSAIWNARLSPRAGAVASTNTTTTSGRSHGGHSTSISRVNSSSDSLIQGISTGQIDDVERLWLRIPQTTTDFYGGTRPVAGLDLRSGQRVEQGRFAGIWAPTKARTGVPSAAIRMEEVEWQLGAAVLRAIMLPPG